MFNASPHLLSVILILGLIAELFGKVTQQCVIQRVPLIKALLLKHELLHRVRILHLGHCNVG